MAALGRREMTKKNRSDNQEFGIGVAAPSVNLRVLPTMIYPTSTLGVPASILGGPIMREGFITATGCVLPLPLK
jgi:hypothetical protein